MSKRLDAAVRVVKKMPPPYQERAVIRLHTLIREWENAPRDDVERSLRMRLRQVLDRLMKRKPVAPLRMY